MVLEGVGDLLEAVAGTEGVLGDGDALVDVDGLHSRIAFGYGPDDEDYLRDMVKWCIPAGCLGACSPRTFPRRPGRPWWRCPL